MCDTCGCNENGREIRILKPGEEHDHDNDKHDHSHGYHGGSSHNHDHHHGHDHSHDHSHDHHHDDDHDHDHHHFHDEHDHEHQLTEGSSAGRIVRVEQDILGTNNMMAERNRGYFEARNITALNLMSSPGSGKTTLLEKTIRRLKSKRAVFVIEGDQQTMNDAYRIETAGAPVVQVNTGNGCHLDAGMINRAVKKLDVSNGAILLIENVGNLVCPSLFDLGESGRVVIISVTEGDDKPAKYPTIFENADLCIINKTDLLPYVDFSTEKAKEHARRINSRIRFIELSAKTEEGFDAWTDWLEGLK